MTALQIAKSRSTARTETHVAFRGAVTNPEWDGMSITVANGDGAGDGNGGTWGNVGQPQNYYATLQALSGGTTSVGVNAARATLFASWAPPVAIGASLRVYRAVNGEIELIRTATVTSAALDYWERQGGNNVITGNSLEIRLDSQTARKTYTFGVARIAANGRIGPVATVSLAVTDPGYTTLTPATPTTGAFRALATAAPFRDAALAPVTGLSANLRAGTTHNVVLTWDAGAPNEFVVFINWDGTSDRLDVEGTLSFDSGPAILTGDMMVLESLPIISLDNSWTSARFRTGPNLIAGHVPRILTGGIAVNTPGGTTWEYVPYGAVPKPDITYPDYYLRVNPTAGAAAQITSAFHAGTDQTFYDTLVPGRTYRAEIEVFAGSAMNGTFAVEQASLTASGVRSLTTSPQTFTFDFIVSATQKAINARFWTFTGGTNGVALNVLSARIWDTTTGYNILNVEPPAGIDMRDHNMIKLRPVPTLNIMTSRNGFGPNGWTIDSLLANCSTFACNPHFQFEWFLKDQDYYDLVTFLYAPASSGEPLALKREAMGYGPINVEFPRHLWESGNEPWNSIMWTMFFSAVDSVTGASYSSGQLMAMFSKRRRAIMESNPYFPTTNPPLEYAGGWLRDPTFTAQAANYPDAAYASVAAYTSGTDVNRVLLADNAARWTDILTISEVFIGPEMQEILALLPSPGPKLSIYEAGPGYQLQGLNGSTVTIADQVVQECMTKSVGGTTALMASVGAFATLGVSNYNFFTWGEGPYWQAARRPSEGGGLYRVASFLKQTYELLGKCRIYDTNKFIDRETEVDQLDTNGNVIGQTLVPEATVYHFESLNYPGRHGILYVNRKLNRDAFGSGHPDYQAGVTGAAEFRYHTGLPVSAVPFKVLRNEGNMRHHDAYKVGFRPNVVGSAIDGYVEDPLCVDLTVTPEDFTVDDPTLRTLTLLGGNCRLEVFTV